jgi:hypothetical protein
MFVVGNFKYFSFHTVLQMIILANKMSSQPKMQSKDDVSALKKPMLSGPK